MKNGNKIIFLMAWAIREVKKVLNRQEVLDFKNEKGEPRNPNLNNVFGGEVNELYNHAWLQARSMKDGEDALVICCEPWDRNLSEEERIILFRAIRSREKDLLAMYGGEYLEIENYL